GLDIPKGGSKPTSFNFSKSEGIELAGGIAPSVKPEARQDAAFGMELSQWSSNVNFTQHFRLKGNGQAKIDLAIVYMACNDENCMPPKTETFSVKVPAYKP
ncbi:MAG TPA: protein-disulfide reductase DsbD family protein, partial [Muribaculaceae bacterium]|nr:protein-disulfide reductase DsbD family protein [Muribaculaceae bacterium]